MADQKDFKTGGIPRRGSSIFRSIRSKMRRKTQQTVESTQRMREMCEETKQVGSATLVTLYTQGEKIDKIQSGLEQMDGDMKVAEENLNKLDSSLCGLCTCALMPFCTRRNAYRTRSYSTTKNDTTFQTNHKKTQMVFVKNQRVDTECHTEYVTRITHDQQEEEMEGNLDAVGKLATSLRMIAINMGNEIDSHNERLEEINYDSHRLDVRLQAANTKATHILNAN